MSDESSSRALTTKNLLVLSALITILVGLYGAIDARLSGIDNRHAEIRDAARIGEIERLEINHADELERLQAEVAHEREVYGARVAEWKELYDEARADFHDSLRLMRDTATRQIPLREGEP